jgi:hypothetical protein
MTIACDHQAAALLHSIRNNGGEKPVSYFDYLACNRELPTGLYGVPPKAIYNSYMAYRNSVDFVVPRNPITGKAEDINSEDQMELERLKGKVVVYETVSDAQGLRLEPYSPIITHRGSEVFEAGMKVMAKHFTLPCLYNLYASTEKTLIEFLCKYLHPGDQAEVYTCWAGEEKNKFKGEVQIIDLEDVVQERAAPDQLQSINGNAFIRYLAPRMPQLQNRIAPVKPVDHVMQVIKEEGQIGVVVHKAQEQGFFQ